MALSAAEHIRYVVGRMAISCVLSVTFLYISPELPLRSWTWLYLQKANET